MEIPDMFKADLDANPRLAQYVKGLHNAIEHYQQHVVTDKLTGLYNIGFYFSQLEKEVKKYGREKKPFALVLADLDDFKPVNDTYGHPVGDEVLIMTSRILQRSTRPYEDFVCRRGGEEFAIILPGSSLQGAVRLAERIRQRVAQLDLRQAFLDEMNVHSGKKDEKDKKLYGRYARLYEFFSERELPRITLSQGIAIYPAESLSSGREVDDFADKALYIAKNKGKDQVRTYLHYLQPNML